MMGNWPTLGELSLIFTVPSAVIVCLVLALTGYGWGSLLFLFGIPIVVYAAAEVYDRQ
jgi:hypothetical protein